MTECLVMKLKGTVDNSSLRRLGEVKIIIDNTSNASQVYRIMLSNPEPVSFEIDGADSHFTNPQGSTNLGASVTKSVGQGELNVKIPAGVSATLSFNPVYNITAIGFSANTPFIYNNINGSSSYSIRYAMRDFKYLTNALLLSLGLSTTNRIIISGSISDLPKSDIMTELNIGGSLDGTQLTGALTDMPVYPNVTYINLSNLTKISGSFNDLISRFTSGDVATLMLSATLISGELSVLHQKYPSLSTLRIDATPISVSDLSAFGVLSNLQSLMINADQLSDKDINKTPTSIKLLRQNVNNQTQYTYTTPVSPRSDVLSLLDIRLTNIDQFLIDMSALPASSYATKTISVYGTRTTASNAAVTNLKGKGYSISVNGTAL